MARPTPTAPPVALPPFDPAWSPFALHSELLTQYLAVQSAWLVPWIEMQAGWLRLLGMPAEAGWPWIGVPVGGDPLP